MIKRIIACLISILVLQSVFTVICSADESIKIGDYIVLGKYENEPIIWRCIDIDENGPLMLSDKGICNKAFDVYGYNLIGSHAVAANFLTGYNIPYDGISNDWRDSTIKCWLNSSASEGNVKYLCENPPRDYNGYGVDGKEKGFLADGNFSTNERNLIKLVSQKNIISASSTSFPKGGSFAQLSNIDDEHTILDAFDKAAYEIISDKMFLLDIKQLAGIIEKKDTLGEDYYLTKDGADRIESSWLRTSNSQFIYKGDYLTTELPNGNVFHVSYYKPSKRDIWNALDSARSSEGLGIRPAFYLKTNGMKITGGAGTADKPYCLEGQNEQNINILADDTVLKLSDKPALINDRVLVPLRNVFESLGASVEWHDNSKTAIITRDEVKVKIQIGASEMLVNNAPVTLDTSAQIINERAYFPVRAISEALYATVFWDNEEKVVKIRSNNLSYHLNGLASYALYYDVSYPTDYFQITEVGHDPIFDNDSDYVKNLPKSQSKIIESVTDTQTGLTKVKIRVKNYSTSIIFKPIKPISENVSLPELKAYIDKSKTLYED